MTGYQVSSPRNGHQVTCSIKILPHWQLHQSVKDLNVVYCFERWVWVWGCGGGTHENMKIMAFLLFYMSRKEGVCFITPWPFRQKGYCCLHLSVCPFLNVTFSTWDFTCPHDNSSQIWARITKFASNMHPGILSAGIENWGHWPWPSRSLWLF